LDLSDAQLLESYVLSREESAFAAPWAVEAKKTEMGE
jgi:hypothetical protein